MSQQVVSNEGIRIVKLVAEATRLGAMQHRVMELAMQDGSWWTKQSEFRGEQPDSSALPNAGALRGDVPLSNEVTKEDK